MTIKNREIERASGQIEQARANLQLKNQEITDSITYAKRIQAAILPSENTLKSYLGEMFVLYLPKDIVAGDFYWTEKIGNTVLFAVADCTGHGVPGAMVSVICHNALNTVINQKGLIDPGQILDETTRMVMAQFEKSDAGVRDGMDIALCAYNKETRELTYSGANTPLWIVRDGASIKYNATRQPVGNYGNKLSFETRKVATQPGDMLYLSTDGFSDQFGGTRGKKFMIKQLNSLFAEASSMPFSAQKEFMKTAFLQWKQEREQVDDVCVMGVRIEF